MIVITVLQFLLIVAVICYLTANMLNLVTVKPYSGSLSDDPPLVSVCVPARNEERDIGQCLTSLLRQDYPAFEIIVVDDHSTDATPKVIRSLEPNEKLTAIQGAPLPPDWLGKPFALHQAAEKAKGDYLMFTDADLVFQPTALTAAVQTMIDKDLGLLTMMPGTRFGSFWERCVQPVIFGFIASLTRFKKVNDSQSKKAMGFGAFLMFRREEYFRVGGHEAVKNQILEDINLARLAKLHKVRLLVAQAKELFRLRMYHSFGEIWRGWSKNFFLAMRKSIPRALFHIFVAQCFLVTPYFVLLGNILVDMNIFWIGVSLVGLGMILFAGAVLCLVLELSPLNVFLFPLGSIIMGAIMINSMAKILVKGKVEWRGRMVEG